MGISNRMGCLLAALALGYSAQAGIAFAIKVKKDTTTQTAKIDTTKVQKPNGKEVKALPKKKETDYDRLMKDSGTVMKGLFTVRHIKDKWYFEMHDSLVGRYFMAVTRFAGVPQGFGKFSGEMVNEDAIYFEKRDGKTMLLRTFVRTQEANEADRIYLSLKQSTADPIVAAFPIVAGNTEKGMNLFDVTGFFARDNNIVGINRTFFEKSKIGGQQPDRTFVDTIKTYPINVEVLTTRTYGASPSNIRASGTGAITLALNTSIVALPKVPM